MKTVKHSILCIILSCVMIFGVTMSPTISTQAETTVLVTRTGSRYHTHKCGNGTYYESTLSAARARGLTPCQKCYGSGYTGSSSTNNNSRPSSNTSDNNPVPKPKKISLNTNSIVLIKGQTKKLSVKNASGIVKWTSSNNSVATISNGIVKAKGKGKTSITVSANGQSKICKVKVEDPKISKTNLNLIVGQEDKQIKITGCSHDVTWISSDDEIVSIDDDGYIQIEGIGSATITGKVHGKKFKCKIKVKFPEVNNIEFVNPVQTVNTYTSFSLETSTDNDIIFYYTDIEAESSDESIISVISIDGNIIELDAKGKEGTATITAFIGNVRVSYDITVTNTKIDDNND